jgi:hypothetical protein
MPAKLTHQLRALLWFRQEFLAHTRGLPSFSTAETVRFVDNNPTLRRRPSASRASKLTWSVFHTGSRSLLVKTRIMTMQSMARTMQCVTQTGSGKDPAERGTQPAMLPSRSLKCSAVSRHLKARGVAVPFVSSLCQQAAAQLAQVRVLIDVGLDDVLLDPLPDLVVVCSSPAA